MMMVLLLAGAMVSGWSLWKQRAEPTAQGKVSSRPDYVLNDFELVALDAKGDESFTLRAPHLSRDPASRTMDIETPLFLIPAGKGSSGDAWEVRARTGWISGEGDELRLRGEVKATSAGIADMPLTIATEQLNVFPETNRISSAVAVSINRPGSILRGQGLEVDLNTKLYTLRSEVRSRYDKIR